MQVQNDEFWNCLMDVEGVVVMELVCQYMVVNFLYLMGWIELVEFFVGFWCFEEVYVVFDKVEKLYVLEWYWVVYRGCGDLFKVKGDYVEVEVWYWWLFDVKFIIVSYINLGVVFLRQGWFEEVKCCFYEVIDFGVDLVDEVYFNLGLVFCVEEVYECVIEYFDVVIVIDLDYELVQQICVECFEVLRVRKCVEQVCWFQFDFF